MPTALDDLAHRAPRLRLLTAPADLDFYGRDRTRRWTPAPLAVAQPCSVEEVQAIVRWANAWRIGIVPSGGRTGLSGGAVAARGELVLSLERMNHVLAFDAVDRTLTVEAGVPLATVHAAAAEHGLLYPVDLAARGSCSIGGNIATNAGGIRVIRYGNTREWVAGLKVVAGTGEVLELNRSLVKNSSGYDFRHLFVGSEGTLGIVVEATLKLTTPAPRSQVMLLALPGIDAILEAFARFRARLSLQAFEFFTELALRHVLADGARRPFEAEYPCYVVTEFDVPDAATEEAALALFTEGAEGGWIEDGVVAQSQAQAAELWRLREGISESLAPHKPYKNDVSVRVARLPAFVQEVQAMLSREYPDIEVVWYGHIGDGNLHINVLPPAGMADADFVARCGRVTHLLGQAVQAYGGSISAEHGVGLAKRDYLDSTRSAADIALMRGVRRVFDPHGILNPGKLVAEA